ncbi:MAG: hypothetical protein CVU56_28255 [Deltaproteobacteria bacterium HGW-Deltaproteobacteria-14]|jgi:hypothetical protein|nr:MAG: hypothetical protein CVU56_28255 [Deltaproteobacteria bacterium HGW-Deltaproteobacteria-14]
MSQRWFPVAVLAAMTLVACGGDGTTGTTPDTADITDDVSVDDASEDVTADVSDDDGDTAADTSSPDTAVSVGDPNVVTLMENEPVTLVGGASAPITVEIPAGASAVTISVLGESAGMYGLSSWSGPDGGVLVIDGWTDGGGAAQGLCLDCPNRIALSEGDFAAIAPNNPAATVVPGTHSFVAFGVVPKPVSQNFQGLCGDGECTILDQFQCPKDCAATPVDGDVLVSVYAKVVAAPPTGGVLDLNLHFTGAKGWTAATAPDDPELQGLLDAVRTIYGQKGVRIRLGEITYRDIDPSFHIIETVQGADSDLMELFSQSEGAPRNAVNLFFVDEISAAQFGGAGVILGVSGGIPGPPLEPGTWRSGVAISVKEVEGAPAGVDTTMAHETGHFLGLFHTSEQSFGFGAQIHDPLPDTPENDESFLMFYTGAGDTLSDWQGRVMRSNPFVRHEAEDMP